MASSPQCTSTTKSTLHLWPNPLPLECGVIRNQERGIGRGNDGKLSFSQLRKMVAYTRSKGKSTYPNMRYSAWLHIAKSKLALSEELAWLYFETFDVVSDSSASDRLHLLDLTTRNTTKEELDEFRKKLGVSTDRFILFLYIQSIPRLSLKSSMFTGEEWPSPETEEKQKSPEYAHLSFLKTHLSEILHLLSATGNDEMDSKISLNEAKVLDFLICTTSLDGSSLSSITKLAMSTSQASKSGYSKISNSFLLSQFEHWVRVHLSLNPFGPQNLLKRRREMKSPCYQSEAIGRILSNPTAPEQFRCTLLHSVNKQTLAKTDKDLYHSNVYIQNCRRSNIYLLAPLRSVQIEKCSRCVLVLGAVETVVTVSNCDSITVVTTCRRLQVSSSSLCVFHQLTVTHPVIFPGSLRLTLAPYNTHYPALSRHMELCGLRTRPNFWDEPVTVGTADGDSGVWELMPGEHFRPISIPFSLEGETEANPCSLPDVYMDELSRRKERIRNWYKVVEKSHLSTDQKKQLQERTMEAFEAWLSLTGHKKDIIDLEPKQTSSSSLKSL